MGVLDRVQGEDDEDEGPYAGEPHRLGMKTDDDRHVGCGKGIVVIDVVHEVRVVARDTPKLLGGFNKLALEGVDDRTHLILGTDSSLCALMGGGENIARSATLRGSEHRRMTIDW